MIDISGNFEILIAVGLLSIIAILLLPLSPYIARTINGWTGANATKIKKRLRESVVVSWILLILVTSIYLFESVAQFQYILEPLSITILILVWSRLVHIIVLNTIQKFVEYRYDEDVVPIIDNIWNLVLILLVVFLVFDTWNIDLTPLLASAGVAGIVIGLAARETISNFFGSIALYADNTYQIGDYIEVEGEAKGYVQEISIRSTKLQTLDGNRVTIPNSKLHKTIVTNRSNPKKEFRIETEVGVTYDVRPDRAKKIIEEVVEEIVQEDSPDALHSNTGSPPQVLMKEFGDSAIIFNVRIWVDYPQQEMRLKDKINRKIYNKLDDENIEIPYPQREVHMNKDSES